MTLKRDPKNRKSNINCLHQSNSKNPLEKNPIYLKNENNPALQKLPQNNPYVTKSPNKSSFQNNHSSREWITLPGNQT